MVQVAQDMLAAMACREVRGNRHCGLSQLTPQSVGLALRECRTEAVDLLDQFDRGLPDLEVWQAAVELVEQGYRFSATFPKCETYGLRCQLREAAVSVPPYLAAGHCREHVLGYLHHLSVSRA